MLSCFWNVRGGMDRRRPVAGGGGGAMQMQLPNLPTKGPLLAAKWDKKWEFCRRVKGVRFKKSTFWVQKQGRSQPHNPGWARVPLFSVFPQVLINFSYFSSNFTYFLPHFGLPGGQVAHPGRPWLCHCSKGPFSWDPAPSNQSWLRAQWRGTNCGLCT